MYPETDYATQPFLYIIMFVWLGCPLLEKMQLDFDIEPTFRFTFTLLVTLMTDAYTGMIDMSYKL